MRLSSPTFDDQVGELSQDDINAFDCLDAQLSQSFADPSRLRQPSCTPRSVTHDLPAEDDENPFRSDNPCAPIDIPQTERIHASFVSASAINTTIGSSRLENESSDEAPPEVDYTAWFNSDSSNSFVGFRTATKAMPGFQRPSINGENAKSLFVPSAAAQQEAEERMKKWQDESHIPDRVLIHQELDSPHSTQPVSPPRATFSSARNTFPSIQAPETPTHASYVGLSHSSLQGICNKRQTKPFKSPLVSATLSMQSHRQVSTPSISSPLRGYHFSASTPSQTAMPVSPLRPSLVANHVTTQHPLGFTPRHGSTTARPKFVTPFKGVVKSDTPRAFLVENRKRPPTPSNPRTVVNRIYPPSVSSPRPSKRNNDGKIFDLSEHKLWILYFPPWNSTLYVSFSSWQTNTRHFWLAATSLQC